MRLSLQDPVSSSGLKLPQSSQVWCISSAPVLRSDFLSDNREDSWLYICLVNFLKLSKKSWGLFGERSVSSLILSAWQTLFQNKLKHPNILRKALQQCRHLVNERDAGETFSNLFFTQGLSGIGQRARWSSASSTRDLIKGRYRGRKVVENESRPKKRGTLSVLVVPNQRT